MKSNKHIEYKSILKRLRSTTLLMLCIAMLTACAPNPTQDFVTSKNDGAFESNIQETAPQQSSDETSLTRTGSFESTDGTVEYVWNIDQTIIDGPMPVVEAVPYFFTTEDARQVATVLFGDAVFYDIGPESERHYSRGELERKINLLSRYADEDTLYALVGPYVIHSDLQKLLRSYNRQLETAPTDVPRSICDWTFKKESYYEDDGKYGMGDGTNDQLNIATTVGGYSYCIAVDVRNKRDYQTSTISVTLGDGSSYVERELQLVELCMTAMPTQEQIDSATAEAQRSLDQMGLGEFVVARASVSVIEAGSVPGYAIVVNAVPVIEGVPGLAGHTGITDANTDLNTESYDSTYPMTHIRFVYNANDQLISFSMHGLTEVQRVRNDNVATLSTDELFAKAQTYLSLFDSESLDAITGNNAWVLAIENDIPMESIVFKVEITGVQYGLARCAMADSDDAFYYTPALLFEGTINFYNKNTGALLDSSAVTLVTINAVDGTII